MAKRKASEKSVSKGVKARKVGVTKTKESGVLDPEEIKKLARGVIESANYNDITKLLDQFPLIQEILVVEEQETVETSARQLCLSMFQIFTKLMKDGLLVNKKTNDEKKGVLVQWLINKYDSFKINLNWFIVNELAYKASLQLDSLDIIMKLMNLETVTNSNPNYFPTITYKNLVKSLITSKSTSEGSDNFIISEFLLVFLKKYDLQFYFFQAVAEGLNEWKDLDEEKETKNIIFTNLYTILNNELLLVKNPNVKDLKTFVKSPPSIIFKTSTFKTNYQNTIMTLLSYDLHLKQYKSILSIMNKRILPLMVQPSNLMDFLTESYDFQDLIVQILSLNSLYELMKTYNLEYPDFYKKLYSLLTPDLLLSRYRARFFRLCDLFLTSTHISANLVASFIKKLARLSIYSGAPGTILVIPFIYNLIKRHPSCMVMVHNPKKYDEYTDPYDDNELDPLKTEAMNSSLWEIEALMNHYHPNISTLSSIFKEPFRKPNYNMEDFLDWTYQSLLDNEINKKYRGMAALEYDEFGGLFGDGCYLEGWTL